jgi:hypothetical protein
LKSRKPNEWDQVLNITYNPLGGAGARDTGRSEVQKPVRVAFGDLKVGDRFRFLEKPSEICVKESRTYFRRGADGRRAELRRIATSTPVEVV